MFFIYCLLLWGLVYFLPILAWMPTLVCHPRVAFAIPILSVFVIYLLSSLLIAIGFFNAFSVTSVAVILGSVALIRLSRVVVRKPFYWTKQTLFVYGFHVLLLFPFFIKLATNAFDRGDEIYSWNFWALQHYFQEPIDFSHTGAPYPQLFPKLLAFCYHLLGNWDLQLPVKGALIVFPFALLNAIGMTLGRLTPAYLFLLFFVLFGVGLSHFFNDGYADPIMTSSLIVSAALYWQSRQSVPISSSVAAMSVMSAITCAHAKQPGLLWALFSLPLFLWFSYRQSSEKTYLWLMLLCIGGGLSWLVGEGSQFYHNEGVLILSWADRDLWVQLAYSVNKYFFQQPLLFLLILLAILTSRKEILLRQMVIFFIIPSLLLWFLFGSYQLRLGQHLIAFAFLIITAGKEALPSTLQRKWWWQPLPSKAVLAVSLGLSVSIAGIMFVREVGLSKKGVSLYAGGRQSLQRYFDKDADFVYATIYSDPNQLLWVPSRYLYGLFYKHTQLTTPDYLRYAIYNEAALIDEFKRKHPNYVFTVNQNYVDGSASLCLANVLKLCPSAFQKVTEANNKYGFTTYKVNNSILQEDPCLQKLAQR
ncbi:MAG: hypothetical protein ACHQJ6_05810 [Candidatus Berkiellales bacterium]